MIFAVCGMPGAFKSAYALEKFVVPALKKGRVVYSNIENVDVARLAVYFDMDPMECEHNYHVLGRVYDDDGSWHEDVNRIRKFYEDLPQNALVVIDEVQNYFNSRDFKEAYSRDLIDFLTKHRHLGNDVVWVTQNLEAVDITFRRNTHLTYALKRAEHLGVSGTSIIYIFDRADTERRHLSRSRHTPNPKIFECYGSYANKDVEEHRKSYNVFLRSPMFILFVIIIVYFLYVVLSGDFSRKVWHTDKVKKTKKTEVVHEKKPVEEKQDSPIVEPVDALCITKTSKIRGNIIYYFSDGSYGLEPLGRILCTKVQQQQ